MDYYSGDDRSMPPEFEEDNFNILFVSPTDREGSHYIPTKSITYPELVYNISITLIMMKSYDKGFLKLCSLKTIPHVKSKVMVLLDKLRRNVSQDTLDKEAAASNLDHYTSTMRSGMPTRDLTLDIERLRNNQRTGQSSDSKDDYSIFPTDNRLCSIFSPIEIKLPDNQSIDLMLSFCLPSIEVSEVKIIVGFEELLKIDLRSIELKAEAPWIKKIDEKVMFTNHMVEDEVTEFESPSQLITLLQKTSHMPVNTMVRLNVEQAYQHNIEVMNRTPCEEEYPVEDSQEDDQYRESDDMEDQ